MYIISHRGYWKKVDEKNSENAFERSFAQGFGTETDIRDYGGKLVISHDVANEFSLPFDHFLAVYIKYHNDSLPLALNIKSDGLQQLIVELLKKHNITNYFVFDMSIPDTIGYLNGGVTFYSRQSEYEQHPALYDHCAGIWLDAFNDIWYSADTIWRHLKKGKKVAIVSTELHKRPHIKQWNLIKKNLLHQSDDVILCTDFPEEAALFFNDPQ